MNTFINPLLTMVHGQISWLSFWSMAKCACAPAGLPLGGPMQCGGAPAACAAARGGRTAGGWTVESRGGLAAAWARCRRPEQRNRGGAARASAAPACARRPRAPGVTSVGGRWRARAGARRRRGAGEIVWEGCRRARVRAAWRGVRRLGEWEGDWARGNESDMRFGPCEI